MDALVLKKATMGWYKQLNSTTRKQYNFYVRSVLKVGISTLVSRHAKVRKS